MVRTEPASPVNLEREQRIGELVRRHSELTGPEIALFRDVVFPQIFHAHYKETLNWFESKGLQVADAKDQCQSTFADLYKRICKKGFPDRLSALIHTIASRKLWRFLRWRHRDLRCVPIPSSSSEAPPNTPDISSALNRRDLAERLLYRLPPFERAAVELVEIHEMTYEEAAALIGLTLGTFKDKLADGRSELRRLADIFVPLSQRLPPR